MQKPQTRPDNPRFSSGPTSKRPGWSLSNLNTESLGRSHRAKNPKARLQKLIVDSKKILGIPDDYLLGIVPASDTGAFEMAMWTMLGQRGVDVLSWESFGQGWLTDIKKQLKLDDVREFSAAYGQLPNLEEVDSKSRDVIFTWNGTTSGVRVKNADWISENRDGLTFCDATSAVFAMDIDWPKLDVITWSWQKVLGGEGGHGMLALSPAAVARLESYTPSWPLPKIFRLAKSGKLDRGIFEGSTINTPSLLAVEDQLDALSWAEGIGGIQALITRSGDNLKVIKTWVKTSSWIEFLAEETGSISSTSMCLKITDPAFTKSSEDEQRAVIKKFVTLLEEEGVALDIGGYRDAPPGLRLWGGATVESSDLEALTPWLDWAWEEVK
ncbi:MAG: phosphoserine transaminase [Pseudomonadales bacterium]|jgi:phosphoserine aminotransferase